MAGIRVTWEEGGVDIDVDVLVQFEKAIRTARKVSSVSINNFLRGRKACDGAIRRFAGEDAGEDAFMVQETARVMYGALAVAAGSLAETTLGRAVGNSDKGYWEDFAKAFKKSNQISIDSLPGYPQMDRVRAMANCFKHRAGRRNQKDVAAIGGAVGDSVAFEKEPWPRLLASVRAFLKAVVKAGHLANDANDEAEFA